MTDETMDAAVLDETVYAATRIRTGVSNDEQGWWLVVHFWYESDPPPGTPPDDEIRVGPWGSEEEARAELVGDFRDLVMGAVRDHARKAGGVVIDTNEEAPS